MGMSASQARLLSLQARMSDVEYEGQQINQQRLVLSNKMNEVMEKMTNMDVPTPPSKQDFLYNKYTGKTKNGKKISAEMNDKGNFDVKKDVAGRIVEDAGLQDITSGSQMRGTEVNIPTKTVDGFHVCQNGEEATAYMSATPASKEDFTEYETKDFKRLYSRENPLRFQAQDNAYNGDEKRSYAGSADSTYITVPDYEAVPDFQEGLYENSDYTNTYYGTTVEESETKYRLTGKDAGDYSAAELSSMIKEEEEWDYTQSPAVKIKDAVYYTTADATEVKSYKTYDPKTRKQLKDTEFLTAAPKTGEKLFAAFHYEKKGEHKFKLDMPLSKADWEKALAEQELIVTNLLGGVTKLDGMPDDFSIDQGGFTSDEFSVKENSQFKYTEYHGSDEIKGNFVQSDASGEAIYVDKSGKTYKGSDIIEHNNDVKKNLNTTYYYQDSDGKFKSCKGSDVKDKGYTAYAKVDNGGTPISNKEQDYESVVKENYYIMDGDNKAQLISANGGIEWAIAQLKAGKKLFSKGTGDVVAYDKDLESDTTVNGCQTMSVAEALGMDIYSKNTAFRDALKGLQQSFPDDWQQFSVIIDNSGSSQSYRFCRTKDLTSVDGQVRVYTPGTGTYQELISNVEPTYDENGYLEKLILPNGEVVDMEVEQAVDEIEYDKAMNKYNIAKIEYDKEVNELNKQTSIYQRQDKQLELKLTRLDTERNALNTEIDAVKKVIQDATEKGFKTFSG